MRALRPSARLTIGGAVAILPVAAGFIDKFAIHPRPFWIHDYDPETIYFYQSLRLLDGLAPSNVDHPGTTLQLLGALIALFTGRGPLHYEAFRSTAYVVAFLLIVAAAIVLARGLFREASPWLAVAAVCSYFLTPRALDYDMIWSAEILYFPMGVLALIAVQRALREDGSGRDAFVAGAAIGLCVATKFLFLGWAAALLVTTRRRWLASAGIAAGFLVGTLPAIGKYPYMLGWVWQNASHAGAYGRGNLSMPDAAAMVRAYSDVMVTSKGWLLWLAAVAVLLWIARRTIDRRLLAFGLIAFVMSYVLPFRAPTPRYLLPAGLAVIALLRAARGVARPAAIAVCALAGLLLAKTVVEDARNERWRVEEQTMLRRQIDAAVRRIAPHGVVVYGWRVPEPSFALRIETTDPCQLAAIATRYPREGHFNDWLGRVFLPPGATRWDVLVIDQSMVPRFPEQLGRPAAAVGPYRVFANPR